MRSRLLIAILLVAGLLLLTIGAAVSASTAARRADASNLEETMTGFLSTIMRQPAANDSYALPDGRTLRVHTLNMGPSNAYLTETDDGLVLIDAGLPLEGQIVVDYLEQIGRDDLKLIYITHAHIDHFGSAAELRRKTGAPIAIHPDDAAALADGKTELGVVRNFTRLSTLALPYIEPLLTIEDTEANLLVEDGARLDQYGLPGTVVHVPGHTPGSTAIVVDGGVSFVGDLLAASGDPHVQSSYAYNWSELPTSLRHLATFEPSLLYTGHGAKPIDGDDLETLTSEFERTLRTRRNQS